MKALRLVSAKILGLFLLLCSMSVAQEAGHIATKHFQIYYSRAVAEADVRRMVDFLQRRAGDIQRELGIPMERAVEVRVYESVGRFLSESRLPKAWRGAFFNRGVLHVQPLQALIHRGIFDRALSFELVQAYLEPVVDKGCPRWLREAYAVTFCGELEGLTPPIGAKLSSFSDLNQDIQVYPNPPQRDDVHFVLGHTMAFLERRFGKAKLMSVFREFDGTRGVETVFKKVFEEDYGLIEKAWGKAIREKTSRLR